MPICTKCNTEKSLCDMNTFKHKGEVRISGICKDCNRERVRAWKKANADRINERRRWRTANDPEYREAVKRSKQKYRTENREHHLELEREGAKRRYRENPEIRQKAIDRSKHFYENRSDEQKQKDLERSRLRNKEPGTIKRKSAWYKQNYDENKQHLIDKMGGQCVSCGTTDNLEFDHINPLDKSLNITHKLVLKNAYQLEEVVQELKKCQLLCEQCHKKKTHGPDRPIINEKIRETRAKNNEL